MGFPSAMLSRPIPSDFPDGIRAGHSKPTDTSEVPGRVPISHVKPADSSERVSRIGFPSAIRSPPTQASEVPGWVPIGHAQPTDTSEIPRRDSHRPRPADRPKRVAQTGFVSAMQSRPTHANFPDGIRAGHPSRPTQAIFQPGFAWAVRRRPTPAKFPDRSASVRRVTASRPEQDH